jgi:PAS domain S-box-containing protein
VVSARHAERDRRIAEAEARTREASREDLEAVHHQLHIHQIELEMQNEELRRTRDELETSRERYFDLYDLAPGGYATLSPQGLIMEANLTLSTRFNRTRSVLIGRPFRRFVSPESADAYTLLLRRLFESGEKASMELAMVAEGGAAFWARIDAALHVDKQTGAKSCRIALTDVTGRRRAQELFEKVFRRSPSPMSIRSLPAGLYLDVNDAFVQVSGYPREEVLGKTFGPGIIRDEAQREAAAAAGRARQPYRDLELDIHAKDGSILHGLVSSEVVDLGDEQVLLTVMKVVP